MSIITWLVFGAIVGFIANLLDPAPSKNGLLGAIVLGILGALVGGFIGNLVFGVGVSGFNISSFIVALIGAMALLWIGRMFNNNNRTSI